MNSADSRHATANPPDLLIGGAGADVHLRAADIIDPETEAHFRFRTMQAGPEQDNRITTVLHDHDFFELFLITSGRLLHWVNGQAQYLQSGDLVFIRPPDRHCFRQLEQDESQLINLAFPVGTVTALFTYLGEGFRPNRLLDAPSPPTTRLSEPEKQTVMQRLTALNTVPHTERHVIRTRLRIVLADLLGRYFSPDAAASVQLSPPWLHNLCQRMADPDNLRGGVQRMRALAHVSPEHLTRTFRSKLGCTPTQYLNAKRLTYAANLLIHSNRPILDISLEIGLENVSYFYRLFKQRYGVTPAQFRTRHRGRPIL